MKLKDVIRHFESLRVFMAERHPERDPDETEIAFCFWDEDDIHSHQSNAGVIDPETGMLPSNPYGKPAQVRPLELEEIREVTRKLHEDMTTDVADDIVLKIKTLILVTLEGKRS